MNNMLLQKKPMTPEKRITKRNLNVVKSITKKEYLTLKNGMKKNLKILQQKTDQIKKIG